jgi:YVTN family beta-propeller protein
MSLRLSLRSIGAAAGLAAAFAVLTGAAATASAQNKTADYLYVVNRDSADIAVVDTTNDTLVARVPVGNVPHQAIVALSLGLLVVSNTQDNTVSIIDLDSLTAAATITLDAEPEHMELSPDGMTVAVGNIGADTVSFVSLTEGRETARVSGLFAPHNLTFSPEGTLLYVANLGANHVSVVDVATARVINEIPVAPPAAVASAADSRAIRQQGIINVTATADGRLGFAAYGDGNALSIIDLQTQTKIKDLALNDMPWRAYASADGRTMIVPNNGDRTVTLIDVATQAVVASLPGATDMTGVNTSPLSPLAFVISRSQEKAVLLDLETRQAVGEIALPGIPETGVTSPDGGKIYVAMSGTGAVAVIDVLQRQVVKTIGDVGKGAWGVGMAGAVGYCH